MVGLLGAFALLLGAAGLSKLIHPASTVLALRGLLPSSARGFVGAVLVRVLATAEVAVCVMVLAWGGPIPAAFLAVAYLVLTVIVARLLRVTPGADCGCLGPSSQPVGRWHLAVTGAGALVGVGCVVLPQQALLPAVVGNGREGLILGVGVVVLSWLVSLVMTALPELENRRAEVAADR